MSETIHDTVAPIQYGLHSVNHLVDIGRADIEALGRIDFALLLVGSAVLVWMLVAAIRADRVAREESPHLTGAPIASPRTSHSRGSPRCIGNAHSTGNR